MIFKSLTLSSYIRASLFVSTAALAAIVSGVMVTGRGSVAEWVGGWLLFATVPTIVAGWLLWWRSQHKLRTHQTRLQQFAVQGNYNYQPGKSDDPTLCPRMSLWNLPGASETRLSDIIITDDWMYGQLSYHVYSKNLFSGRIVAEAHYAVLSMGLPRELPNVFFDSLSSRGSQFGIIFNPKQRHSLEGDFDDHFATFFPEAYSVDGMSFISPDVMWSVMQANDYDIEIVGDKLYMYGPLEDPDVQIRNMAEKLATIRKSLLNNIRSYRDERLPYEQGRLSVSPLGARLHKPGPWKYATPVAILIIVIFIVLRFVIDAVFGI